jgi:diguanylate cyclase (GGDEF)-like protein/PAS domain S-box-containing protein
MIAAIKKWFEPPVFEGDEEKMFRVSLLNAGAITVVLFSFLVIVGSLLGGRTPSSTIFINLFGITIGFLLRFWLYHGKIDAVGAILLILGFILITAAIITLGTIRTPTTTDYLLLVVIAGVLFELRGIVVSTIVSSLAVLGLIIAENAGILPQPDYTVTITQWVTYTSLFGATGGLAFFSLKFTRRALVRAQQEIKERERADLELRKLTQAVEQSPASIALTDLDGNIEYVNPRFTQVTGYSFDEALGKNPRILKTDLTPPETYRQLWKIISAGKEWHGEFVNRKKNGSLYYESAIISPITDLNGVPTHYLAIKEDITERKRAEEKIRQQNEYFTNLHQITLDLLSRKETQTLLNNIAHYAMSLVNAQHGYIFLPDGDSLLLCAATGGFAHNIGRREPKPGVGVLGHVWQSMETVIVENYSEWEFRDPNYKSEDLLAIAGVPIKIESNIIGVLQVANTKTPHAFSEEDIQILTRFATLAALVLDNAQLLDSAEHEITERKRNETVLQKHVIKVEHLQAELREQALRDPLTGLHNRRYLSETIEREIARARRENTPLSVIVSDIDHFKIINDTYGHQAGDKFLTKIASLMKEHARESDIVCRYGGEEFLLVLPGTTLESAAKRAEEIRQKCAELILNHEGKDLKVMMSFGVATHPNHGKEAEEIIIKADKALYGSKRNGRNCVTIWDDGEDSKEKRQGCAGI